MVDVIVRSTKWINFCRKTGEGDTITKEIHILVFSVKLHMLWLGGHENERPRYNKASQFMTTFRVWHYCGNIDKFLLQVVFILSTNGDN